MASELEMQQPLQQVEAHPSPEQGDLTRSDSGRNVEIEYINDKTVNNIIPAAVAMPQRVFSGSVRSQFAAVLQEHFLACTNPESGRLCIALFLC
jgi:hypothetical protein